METYNTNSGLRSGFNGNNSAQQSDMWRPWTGNGSSTATQQAHSIPGGLSDAQQSKVPQFVHPVKLYWPKKRCFDYLYREAEALLRNYPVQATICPYEDSSSDEDSEDEEEPMEKELN
ncbi:protein ripply2 [Parambassis ranga]|uniref:Protein ripply2 n=1 Tax=Parambassis ranga TaxID=210632 RepID=A0A6P7HSU2_9TELE|nr:protein ripply2-like [Parambassis ranga]